MTPDRAIAQALEQAQRGQWDAAILALRRLVQREPRSVAAHQALGHVLVQRGEMEQGLYMLRRGVALAPASAPARNNFGVSLMGAGRAVEAAAELREAVRLDPSYGIGWTGLAAALVEAREYDGAIEAGRRARELMPGSPDAHLNLALAGLESGRVEEAIADLRDAVARFPGHARLHSLLLMALNNSAAATNAEILDEHTRFGAAIRPPVTAPPARITPDPEKKLRLGFLSGDFATHSVMYFLWPILERLDRERFEIVCYSAGRRSDEATGRARALASAWVEAGAMDDTALDARIRADGIDVMIDLGGHTATARLPALLARPAPVIISAIGYPNTTGVPAVGYRLVDSRTDPPPAADRWATEKLLRLDPCFLCYRPAADAPVVSPSPAAASGIVTFGSFNALPKISPPCLEGWAAVLNRTAGSRLLLKSAGHADRGVRERTWTLLESRGIDRSRVEMLGQTRSVAEHLALYSRIDIALDTFPYNGTTTTCEALWMGVPVVTFAGDRHAARVGLSLLTAASLPELVARDAAGFVQTATALATDLPRLTSLRAGLRDRLRASALCDEPAYAARWAEAVRGAWRVWCADPA
jgi:protein O-GlcNAc transferase